MHGTVIPMTPVTSDLDHSVRVITSLRDDDITFPLVRHQSPTTRLLKNSQHNLSKLMPLRGGGGSLPHGP